MTEILSPIADPSALLDTLDPKAIAAQLADLDREARALRALLRVARLRHGDKRSERRAINE